MRFSFNSLRPKKKAPPAAPAAAPLPVLPPVLPRAEQEKRFITAAVTGDLPVMKEILALLPDVATCESKAMSIGGHYQPVFIPAVLSRQFEAADLLLAHGADINGHGGTGISALSWAAGQPERDAELEYLFSRGADIDFRDHLNRTPQDVAKQCGHRRNIALIEAERRRRNRSAALQGAERDVVVTLPALRPPSAACLKHRKEHARSSKTGSSGPKL